MDAGRAVVHLWGVLEDRRSFLVRDRRAEPCFFIRADDTGRAASLGLRSTAPDPPLRAMDGRPVARLSAPTPPELERLRRRLEAAGIDTLEADLRFAQRYLIDRGLCGGVEIDGPARPGGGAALCFDDPRLAPAAVTPELRVLSLDIETTGEAERVLSVALSAPGVAEVLILRDTKGGGGPAPDYATVLDDEPALLTRFAERVRAIDPDVLTGWNVIGFDLAVLERRARAHGLELRLGRGSAPLTLRLDRSYRGSSRAEIEGRLVLDGPDLLRGAAVRLPDQRLDTVARIFLGEGKDIAAHGRAKVEEILHRYHHDLAAFSAYNLKDAELVPRILEHTGVLRLAIRRSLLTGLPPDRVGGAIASLDALYLPELHRRGFVAPSVGAPGEGGEPTAGGAVLEPVPGLHERVAVFDFKSLYPSLIRTFNIDPLSHRPAPAPGEAVIRTPSGDCFAREPGILPELLTRLGDLRAEARRQGDGIAAQATKILMNSFYGVLATPACRFHSPALANAITRSGQALLGWTRDRSAEMGYRVLYGDTDSLFVATGAASDGEARAAALRLGAELNRRLADHLASEYGVPSRMELEFEGLYLRLFLPHVRHGEAGARKRYAGLIEEDGRREVVFVGMETVRRDWTRAAKDFQRGLYERVFAGLPVEAWVRDFLRSLAAGERDADLVYRKALRKPVEAYTTTTPPHVQAARKAAPDGRLVEYVMTTAGPEPADRRGHPLDYGHYVEKQIRPIAEAILPEIGLDWDEVAGNPRQPGLF